MDGLQINGLTVDFGRFKLDNVNLNIKSGCVTGLVGRNGAGKSTLIKTIMRQQEPNSGNVLYNGLKFAEHELEILNSIACVFDTPNFNTFAKPKNIVKLYKASFKNFDMEMYHRLMIKFNLPNDLKINKYSYGMQKKYNIILALCQRPEILILDEPTSGIDPFDRNEIVGLIQEFMMDENHTVLFSTHITEDLDKIADYIVMLEDGKVTLDEDKLVLTERYRLIQCAEMTERMRASAIGIQKSMFGYTFLTSDKELEGEGIQSKVPTVEEMFIHMLGGRSM